MADEEVETGEEDAPKKKGKLGLIIGLVLALAGGGGAFFAIYSGMILGGGEEVVEEEIEPLPTVSFVPIEPMVVTVGISGKQQLRFQAELEVTPESGEAVALLMPRILDVLNGYLRAVEIGELENPSALIKLRAQMLRRVQLVTGDGHVRDLLITEFVFT